MTYSLFKPKVHHKMPYTKTMHNPLEFNLLQSGYKK